MPTQQIKNIEISNWHTFFGDGKNFKSQKITMSHWVPDNINLSSDLKLVNFIHFETTIYLFNCVSYF